MLKYSELKERSIEMSKTMDFNSTQTADTLKSAIKDYALRFDKDDLLKRLIPNIVEKNLDIYSKCCDKRYKVLAMNLWKCKFMLRAKEK